MAGALAPKKARTRLGMEYDGIVFDAALSFDADAFGAIAGTLCGGGLLLLLVPRQDEFQALTGSRFLRRLWSLWHGYDGVYFLEQGGVPPGMPLQPTAVRIATEVAPPFRTPEQQRVVQMITAAALGGERLPLVLVSDRGRGKSSALGLAAGQLLQQGIGRIIVTAPRLTISDPVFRHAQQLLNGADARRGELRWKQGWLGFMAPDALLEQRPQADLLLVDEAAAIPLPLLEQLLRLYPMAVFATTVHGYEGTGRGFTLKFYPLLDELAPGWQRCSMETPVRWAVNDPLERWIDRVLCLDAELPAVSAMQSIDVAQCSARVLDRDELSRDEVTLSTLFALLVYAHYRTRPSDLQRLLDDPNIRIYVLEYRRQIVAALLVSEEGGFGRELSSEIYRGNRRPGGHMLAQTLTFHAGCEMAATLTYARVMRIAVHPALQGNGLGSRLLQEVEIQERQQGVDAIGTSFGATSELLRFWRRAGFVMVRMGFTRDHASGTHSAVMLKSLTAAGEAVLVEVRERFRYYLASWLSDPLRGLPAGMRRALGEEQQLDTEALSASDWKEIASFACTRRGYESCMWPLQKLVRRYPALLDRLSQSDRQVLEARVRRQMSWADTVVEIRATGKAEALGRLREAAASLLLLCGEEGLL